MVDFQVADLSTLLGKLRVAGVEMTTKDKWNSRETGQNVRQHDPEGHAVEL